MHASQHAAASLVPYKDLWGIPKPPTKSGGMIFLRALPFSCGVCPRSPRPLVFVPNPKRSGTSCGRPSLSLGCRRCHLPHPPRLGPQIICPTLHQSLSRGTSSSRAHSLALVPTLIAPQAQVSQDLGLRLSRRLFVSSRESLVQPHLRCVHRIVPTYTRSNVHREWSVFRVFARHVDAHVSVMR